MVVEGTLTDAGLPLDSVPQILKAIDRASDYDLTEEAALNLFYAQKGVCAICKEPFSEQVIVEHRHEDEVLGRTHLVRGYTCRRCNKTAEYYDGVEAHSGQRLNVPWWTEYNQCAAQVKVKEETRQSCHRNRTVKNGFIAVSFFLRSLLSGDSYESARLWENEHKNELADDVRDIDYTAILKSHFGHALWHNTDPLVEKASWGKKAVFTLTEKGKALAQRLENEKRLLSKEEWYEKEESCLSAKENV